MFARSCLVRISFAQTSVRLVCCGAGVSFKEHLVHTGRLQQFCLNVIFSATQLLLPFVALIFKKKGLSTTETGLIIGWQFVISFFFRLGVAGAADKYHKHKHLLILFSVVTACFMSAIWWLPSRDRGIVETQPAFTCSQDTESTTELICRAENGTVFLSMEAENFLQDPSSEGQGQSEGQKEPSEGENYPPKFACKHINDVEWCSFAQNATNKKATVQVHMTHYIKNNCTIQCTDSTHKGIVLDLTFWSVLWIWFGAINSYVVLWALLYGMNYDLLGDNKQNFGRQRMWGTLGAILMAVVSAVAMNDYKSEKAEINYIPCFVGYAIFIVITGIIGLFFKLEYKVKQPKMTRTVLGLFKQPQLCLLFCVITVMGFLFSAIGSFIFVFLRQMDASSWVFGAALFTRFVSEIPTLYFTGNILKKLGYVNCVYLVLLLNSAIYVSTSFLTNPWWELPLAALKSFTYSIGFMALSVHTSSITPPAMNATLQALVQNLHYGIGKETWLFIFAAQCCGHIRNSLFFHQQT